MNLLGFAAALAIARQRNATNSTQVAVIGGALPMPLGPIAATLLAQRTSTASASTEAVVRDSARLAPLPGGTTVINRNKAQLQMQLRAERARLLTQKAALKAQRDRVSEIRSALYAEALQRIDSVIRLSEAMSEEKKAEFRHALSESVDQLASKLKKTVRREIDDILSPEPSTAHEQFTADLVEREFRRRESRIAGGGNGAAPLANGNPPQQQDQQDGQLSAE